MMKRNIYCAVCLLTVLCLDMVPATAQTRSYDGTITVKPIQLEQKGDFLHIDIDFDLKDVKVKSTRGVDFIPQLVGYHLLPANPTGHVNNIRTYTMGVLAVAQMGRCMGEVAYKVSDSTFLWCNALLRRLLCATVIRHCTVHTGRKPDGNHSKRTDNGGLLAKQLLLRRLLDGGKYRGTEMPKPRAGLGSMDDT